MGREGDLFKDLDPIMEEPVLELDPVTVVSMISSGEDITTQSTNVSDISSIQSGHLLSEVFYGDSQLIVPRDLGFVSLTSYFNFLFFLYRTLLHQNTIEEVKVIYSKLQCPSWKNLY